MYIQIIQRKIKIATLLLLCIVCTSCWNSTNIEDQIYISALGVDYKDEEYIIYAQIQNFESIIEFQPRTSNPSAGSYVGISKGKTMFEAALNLTRSAQTRIDWGHVEAMVVSEEAMKKDGVTIPRRMYRFPETRYNSWFYVTNSSIYDILTTGNIYDDSSLITMLYMPESTYKQKSTILPLRAFKVVAKLTEPDRTVAIPSIKINKEQWKTPETDVKLLEIGGAFFTSMYGQQHTFDLDDIPGYRLTQIPARTEVSIRDENEDTSIADIVLRTKKKLIDVEVQGTDVYFTLNLTYLGGMYEFSEYMPYEETMKKLKETIASQIRQSYKLGVDKKIDILNLMPALRQRHPQIWHQLTDNGKTFILNESSLAHININVRVPYNGKYKRLPDDIN